MTAQEEGQMREELLEVMGRSRAASRHISTTLTLGLGNLYFILPVHLTT
jgi:hypothetical protein